MKIRIHSPSGYHILLLQDLELPLVVEAYKIESNNAAYVKASIMSAYGVSTCGVDYVFLPDEYDVVLEITSYKSQGETWHTMEHRQERKAVLLRLIEDYGIAINDGCHESECGSIDAMQECQEEEERLLAEIIKMIEEGV